MLRSISPTDCDRAREAASVRADGELSAFEAAALDAHLHACADCRAFAASLGRLTSLLRGDELVRPATPVFVPRRRRPAFRLNAAAAAAAVAVAAASSFAVGHVVGSRGGPSATGTVGTTLGAAAASDRSQVFGMLRRIRLGRMSGQQVIPV
jgi:predicted anti-sigma-YlaC factor YlaD